MKASNRRHVGRRPVPSAEAASGPWADVRRGVGVLRGDRTLGTITLVSAASIAVLAPLHNLVLPVYLVGKDSPGGFGLVVSCLAVGGIVGAGVYAALGAKLPRRTVFVVSQLVSMVGVAGLALLPPVPMLVPCAVLAGIGAGPLPALFLVLVTERIPEDVRGRVLGLQNAVSMTAVPLSTLFAGLVVEWVGLRETGVALAVAWCGVSLLLLAVPALRHLDTATAATPHSSPRLASPSHPASHTPRHPRIRSRPRTAPADRQLRLLIYQVPAAPHRQTEPAEAVERPLLQAQESPYERGVDRAPGGAR